MTPLMGIQALADYLGVSKATIYGWRHDKADCPPTLKVGGRLRWRREDVDAWLDASKEDQQPTTLPPG